MRFHCTWASLLAALRLAQHNLSMPSKPIRFGVAAVALLLTASLFAAREFKAPRAFHAKTYPARDEHPLEKATIAADPFDLPDKAQVFSVPYKENGLLPVHFIISNDGSAPLVLTGIKVELITSGRVKIPAASTDDIYRRFSHVKHRGDEPSRLPVPLPRKKAGGTITKDMRDEVEAAQFRAKAVEPQSTAAGFLFFDVEGISQPLAGAHLYVTGIRDDKGQDLMYFEIPLEKYLTYRPGQ